MLIFLTNLQYKSFIYRKLDFASLASSEIILCMNILIIVFKLVDFMTKKFICIFLQTVQKYSLFMIDYKIINN